MDDVASTIHVVVNLVNGALDVCRVVSGIRRLRYSMVGGRGSGVEGIMHQARYISRQIHGFFSGLGV